MKIHIKPTFGPVASFACKVKPQGKTRAERKAARNANFAAHPVLSGAVPVVAYVPPGHYGRKN